MPMAYQTFTHQIWWAMVYYDLAHQIRWAKHTFSGRCDITTMVCCSFGGHSTPQFLQCGLDHLHANSHPNRGLYPNSGFHPDSGLSHGGTDSGLPPDSGLHPDSNF